MAELLLTAFLLYSLVTYFYFIAIQMTYKNKQYI